MNQHSLLLIVLLTGILVAPFSMAEVYKYTDKDGNTYYSDVPNANSKLIRIAPAQEQSKTPNAAPSSTKDKNAATTTSPSAGSVTATPTAGQSKSNTSTSGRSASTAGSASGGGASSGGGSSAGGGSSSSSGGQAATKTPTTSTPAAKAAQANTTKGTAGNTTAGNTTAGNTTTGNTTTGNTTTGNTTTGNTTTGNTTTGNTTTGNTTTGNSTTGNSTTGNSTTGNSTTGNSTTGNSTTGNTTTGNTTTGLVNTTPAKPSGPADLSPKYFLNANDFRNNAYRGFNVLGRKLSLDDMENLGNLNVNLVRSIIHLEKCATCTAYSISSLELNQMDLLVETGKKKGFFVVFSFDPKPAGDQAIYWNNAQLKESIKNQWLMVANKYKNSTIVAGYDIINEPVTNNVSLWNAFFTDLITAIRKVDQSHIIFVEATPWGGPSALSKVTPLPFSNLVYSFHFYAPHELTHQGLPAYPLAYTYPSGAWNKDFLNRQIDVVSTWAEKYDLPIYVGEFSIIRWAPLGSRTRYLTDVVERLEQQKWSWTYHSYREWSGWDAEMPDSDFKNDNVVLRKAAVPAMQLLQKNFDKNIKLE